MTSPDQLALSPADRKLCEQVKKRCEAWLAANPEPEPPSFLDAFLWGLSSLLTLGLHDEAPPSAPQEPIEITTLRVYHKVILQSVNELLERHDHPVQ